MRTKIKDLKAKRAETWEAQKANLEEARTEGFNAERRAKHEQLEGELDRISAEIDAEERSYQRSIGEYEMRGPEGEQRGKGVERRLYRGDERLTELVTPSANTDSWLRALVGGPTEQRMDTLTPGAGGYIVPTGFAADIWDLVRNQSRAIEAGVTTWVDDSGHQDLVIPKVVTDAEPAWRAENDAVAVDDITLGTETADPKSLALEVKASLELIQDTKYDLESFVKQTVARKWAEVVDAAILNGPGTGNAPTGIRNAAGIGSTATSGTPTFAKLAAAYLDVRGNNYEPSAAILSHRDEATFSGLTDTTGQPLQAPANVANVPRLATNQIPTNLGAGTDESFILTGQFDQAVFAIKLGLTVVPMRERHMGNLQVSWVFYGRYDVVVLREGAFHVLEGVTV